MSDPPKVIIKSSKTSLPESIENGGPSCSTSPALTNRISEPEILQPSSSFLRRHLSKRFSRSSSQRSDANVEAIILEETPGPKRQPVTLKASFLRRKIEEYEGNFLPRWLIKVSVVVHFRYQQYGIEFDLLTLLKCESFENWHCRKKSCSIFVNFSR